jgi:DNA-binding response OmpR family regulator
MANARICLVDDDHFVRDALALGLTDAGFEVSAAAGAAAGFDIALRQPIDAVVTDMNMPGTSGAQFISEARAAWPNMPIIVISGASETDGRPTADVARELGADATLLKPFRAHVLADLLKDLLKKHAGG